MADHRCHLPGCTTPTPPRLLMCRAHWGSVDAATQREVYRTVALRGPSVDASWAPWWRAAHRAIAQALRAGGADEARVTKYLDYHTRFADNLEGR